MSGDGEVMPMGMEPSRAGEMLAIAQMTQTVNRVAADMTRHGELIMGIKEDIAVIKTQQVDHGIIKAEVDKLKTRVDEVEKRNSHQDGALSLVTFMKDFGPWAVSLVLLAWGVFSRHPG